MFVCGQHTFISLLYVVISTTESFHFYRNCNSTTFILYVNNIFEPLTSTVKLFLKNKNNYRFEATCYHL